MNGYNIQISTDKADLIPDIMVALSKYECDIRIDRESSRNRSYAFSYKDLSFSRLGEKDGRTSEQYKNEMKLYKHAGNVLTSFGLSKKHKGYLYAIECIRLINTYGPNDFKMDNDVYPIIASWYNVSSHSVEHNVRNAISNAWDKAIKGLNFDECSMSHFDVKPTNLKFLKHAAKITNLSLINAETGNI